MINDLLRNFEHRNHFQMYVLNALKLLYNPEMYPEIQLYEDYVHTRKHEARLAMFDAWHRSTLPKPNIGLDTTAGSIIHCTEMMKLLPKVKRERIYDCVFGDINIIGTHHKMYDDGIWGIVGETNIGLIIPNEWFKYINGCIPNICISINKFKFHNRDVMRLLGMIVKSCSIETVNPNPKFTDYLINHLENAEEHFYGCWFPELMIPFAKLINESATK